MCFFKLFIQIIVHHYNKNELLQLLLTVKGLISSINTIEKWYEQEKQSYLNVHAKK